MNFEKIRKRIQRELTRSPKKTAVLGVMTLVAVYFWVPIVSGWVWEKPATTAKRATTETATTETATTETATTETATTETATTETASTETAAPATAQLKRTNFRATAASPSVRTGAVQHPWFRLEASIEGDKDMRSVQLSDSSRDPFVNLALERARAAAEAARREKSKLEFTVKDLDLTLSNTLVASHGGRATINGIVYRPGDPIRVRDETDSSLMKTDIFVKRISARKVVLLQKGFQFTLRLRDPRVGAR